MAAPFGPPTPPDTVSEWPLWEIYWAKMLSLRLGTAFHDLFSFALDGEFTRLALASGVRHVLCVGNGISFEPHGLAAAGMDVDALDLSPYATHIAQHAEPHPKQPHAFCPPDCVRDGGRARFVSGDALKPSICPGPYDAIVERRFLQLVPEADRPRALDAMRERLAPTGFLLSHAHNGAWRPDEPRLHPLDDAFRKAGWTVHDDNIPDRIRGDGRTAVLLLTTG